jgi:aryl-alcohol dehydrogenase-like predicted oxidoreductase
MVRPQSLLLDWSPFMKYRPLGRSGMFVSEFCLGTMTFGGKGGFWPLIGQLGQDEVTALMARAFAAGVNFIDTAEARGYRYCD